MKNIKAFSLVEMVVAIIVIGILSIVSVPVYRGYVKRAYESEGKALLGSIVTGEEHFYVDFDYFAETEETESFANINVDANDNKYFRTFSIDVDGDSFTATTYGTDAANGIELTLVYTPNGTQVYETYADASTGGGSGSGSGSGSESGSGSDEQSGSSGSGETFLSDLSEDEVNAILIQNDVTLENSGIWEEIFTKFEGAQVYVPQLLAMTKALENKGYLTEIPDTVLYKFKPAPNAEEIIIPNYTLSKKALDQYHKSSYVSNDVIENLYSSLGITVD